MAVTYAAHPPPPPICGKCERHSAVFLVDELTDLGQRVENLCTGCLRCRTLLWERFAVHVHVTALERQDKSSE